MKRICGILGIFLLTASLFSGCGSDGSSVLKKHVKASENFINGMSDAKSADDMVKTIDKYTEDLRVLMPELMELEKKYPGYRDGKIPEELEADVREMEKISLKMSGSMGSNMMKYMMDTKVQDAMTRLGEELEKLEQ
ncbi:MAG: hypothetical protein JW755_03000 [Candidatus Aminicenantes bacterium]|nr:hypothetical protein [Candidatus Aminicenantes bacterium]